MYLVSATKKLSSVRVAVATAGEALHRLHELEDEGYTAVIISDFGGREITIEDVKAHALEDGQRAL